jgi:AcrR family transcriptional regulator
MPGERKRRVDPARAAHRAARRERLLDAAADAIRAHGAGTSMDAIAADVGVAKPVLYRYFDSREGLMLALADRFSAALATELRDALARDAAPQDALRAAIDTYLRFVEREPALYRFLTNWAEAEHPQALTGLMAQMGEEIGKVLGERIQAIGVDPEPAVPWGYGMVGMVHLAGDWWLERGGMDRERLVDHLVTLLWRGIDGYAREERRGAQPSG